MLTTWPCGHLTSVLTMVRLLIFSKVVYHGDLGAIVGAYEICLVFADFADIVDIYENFGVISLHIADLNDSVDVECLLYVGECING